MICKHNKDIQQQTMMSKNKQRYEITNKDIHKHIRICKNKQEYIISKSEYTVGGDGGNYSCASLSTSCLKCLSFMNYL